MQVCLLFFLSSCYESPKLKEINLSEYTQIDLKDEHTNIYLIKSYEASNCQGKEVSAVVYECLLESADTVLVLEPCGNIPDFAQNNFQYKDDLDLIMMKKNVQSDFPLKVFVNANVKMNSKSKYIVGVITRLEY